jgi:hypothetical protein
MDSPLPNPFNLQRPRYQSRYFHGEAGGPLVSEKLFTSLSAQRLSQDRGPIDIHAVTPAGPMDQRISSDFADQVFNGRSQYQVSARHQLNINGRYRTLVMPNIGLGLPVARKLKLDK